MIEAAVSVALDCKGNLLPNDLNVAAKGSGMPIFLMRTRTHGNAPEVAEANLADEADEADDADAY